MPPRILDLDLILDSPQLRAEQDRVSRFMLNAGKNAVAEATKGLERELEALTREAAGGRLWRAWKSEVFPRNGIAREPVGSVFVNGGARSRGAIEYFSRPGRIKSKSGRFLAIPTPAAGSKGRKRDLTPEEWEARTGETLRFVYRRGRPSLLVAEGMLNGRTGTYRRWTRARSKADERRGFRRGATSVVIFVLIPQVAFANRFAVDPVIQKWGRHLVEDFGRRARMIDTFEGTSLRASRGRFRSIP
jgi:hypothetical protein